MGDRNKWKLWLGGVVLTLDQGGGVLQELVSGRTLDQSNRI